MAELARRNCDLLDVTVETIPFEDWEPPPVTSGS
jgi:hypothetical protein